MRYHICRQCGDSYETDEAERWRKKICPTCARIDEMEREIMKEWEIEQGYREE